jgi:hypothetical protein
MAYVSSYQQHAFCHIRCNELIRNLSTGHKGLSDSSLREVSIEALTRLALVLCSELAPSTGCTERCMQFCFVDLIVLTWKAGTVSGETISIIPVLQLIPVSAINDQMIFCLFLNFISFFLFLRYWV